MTPPHVSPGMATARQSGVRTHRLVRPLAVWLGIAFLAVCNGVVRELVIAPRTTPYAAHVISTLLLVGIVLGVSYWYFSDTDYTRVELLAIGVVWVVLTVVFEFGVGYVEDGSIQPVLDQYDVLAGQIWVLVLLALFVAPLLIGEWLAPDR